MTEAQLLMLVQQLWPIGLIGLWRWASWLYRVYRSRKFVEYVHVGETTYKTIGARFTVKGEPPEHFERVLQSMVDTGFDVIRVVLDSGETVNASILNRFILRDSGKVDIMYEFTDKKGKRSGLQQAIYMSGDEDVTVLFDSDVVCGLPDAELTPALKSVRAATLEALSQPNMGGVVVAQRVYKPTNWVQRLFDIMLVERYEYELPGQAFSGYVSCLSGRCSAYPRTILLKIADQLTTEQWAGIAKTGGGEDKWLTTRLHDAGYNSTLTRTATVYTRAEEQYGSLMLQLTRWMRNSWFSDIRALLTRPWMKGYLRFFAIDRMMGSFTVLFAPWFLFYTMVNNMWLASVAIVVWWCISRWIKIRPYLKQEQKPGMLPVYIMSAMVMGVVKLHALTTLGEEAWAGSRGGKQSALANAAYFATLIIIVIEGLLVFGPLTP